MAGLRKQRGRFFLLLKKQKEPSPLLTKEPSPLLTAFHKYGTESNGRTYIKDEKGSYIKELNKIIDEVLIEMAM